MPEPSPDPATGSRTARFGLGGASLGNHRQAITDAEAYAVLEEAWARGIRHFDTAPHYGLGLSERRLGAFLADKPRDSFTLSTKVGRRLEPVDLVDGALDTEGFLVPADARRVWDFSTDGVRRTLEASLERLGVDAVDIAYLHDPERWDLGPGVREGARALDAARTEGLVARIGVGSMTTAALLAGTSGDFDDLMVAGRLTVLDSDAATRVVPAATASGTTITAAAVLNGGLLAAQEPTAGTFDYAAAPSAIVERAQRIVAISRDHGVHPGTVALHYPLLFTAVERVVIGVDSPAQTRETLGWARGAVPPALWSELADDIRLPIPSGVIG